MVVSMVAAIAAIGPIIISPVSVIASVAVVLGKNSAGKDKYQRKKRAKFLHLATPLEV
jgi:hypothetical protein